MELNIYNKSGNLILTASPNTSSSLTEEIGGECSVSASFTHTSFILLDVDTYIELEGVRYKVKSRYRPKQKDTQTYEYSVKFYAPIHDAEDTLMLFQEGGTTSEFSFDGGPREHLQLWIDNMNRRAGGNLWSIGTVITADNKTIEYRNVKCWDAAFGSNGIAATFETEMWADGYVINLCKAERGEIVELGYLQGLTNLAQEDNGEVKFFTRLFPLGSTRNIDATKYGYSRLQLPSRAMYVDKNVDLYGVKEETEEAAFSEIFPKYIGTVSSVRTEEKTNEEGREYTVYYFKDDGMNWNPKDYEIPDLDYMLQFQTGELAGRGTDGSFQAAWHEDTNEWEIINVYPNDTTQIPGDVIIPKPGDTYIPWNFSMPQEYVTAAEQAYELAVNNFLSSYSFDPNKYTGTTDRNYIERNATPLRIGWNVRLLSEQYFSTTGGYKDTRITKVQRKLNDLCQATITCTDKIGTTWKSSVENKLDSLQYVMTKQEQQAIIDIIKTTDSKTPSDYNVLSALKAIGMFLRKDKPDSTNYLIKFLGGLISDNIESQDFASGPFGTGYVLKRDGKTGKSYMEIDELYVRLKAYFDTLEIKHLSHVGGRIVLSPASMECNRVEKVSGESETLFDSIGSQLYDSSGSPLEAMVEGQANVYRCYFNNTDGEKDIVNEFSIDDLAQCREFNVKENISHNVSNQYYWRRVVGLGDNYIDLSISDCDTGSMEPKAGDTIVTVGNKSDENRQHVVYLSSYDEDAPCFKLYSGINDYSMLNKEVTVISPNADKNVFTGKVVIKSGSTGFENFEDAPDFKQLEEDVANAKNDANEAKSNVESLKGYVDGAFADGIITESEAKAISTYINTVESTYNSAYSSYIELYNNEYLEGDAKTGLKQSFDNFVKYESSLINTINNSIVDGKTDSSEKAQVDSAYANFNTAYGQLITAIETANKAIQDRIKELAAEQATNDALQAIEGQIQEVTDAAKDDIAKQMGYTDYAQMQQAATRGETLIDGGMINTTLIEAKAIVTSALIASAIKTSTLNVNDKFIVYTDGSVNMNGSITNEEDGRRTVLSNGFFRLMAKGQSDLDFFERMRINTDEKYEPEIFMTASKTGICNLSITPKSIVFDYVNNVGGGRTNLLIDPTIIGAGMKNAVIKKTAEGILYVAEEDDEKYQLTINVSGKGTTTPTPGTRLVNKGQNLYVSAYPDDGYKFDRWSDGGAQGHYISVNYDNYLITAYFVKSEDKKYSLSTVAIPSNGGTTSGDGTYNENELVTVSATPKQGYEFSRWSDGGAQSHSVLMNSNKTLTAYFDAYSTSGENLFEGANLTDKSYWESEGGVSVLVGAGVVMLVYPSEGTPVAIFNREYLGGKIKTGHKYELSITLYASKEDTYVMLNIDYKSGTGGDPISGESVIMSSGYNVDKVGKTYTTLKATFTAVRESTSQDYLWIFATLGTAIMISAVSLKEVE